MSLAMSATVFDFIFIFDIGLGLSCAHLRLAILEVARIASICGAQYMMLSEIITDIALWLFFNDQ